MKALTAFWLLQNIDDIKHARFLMTLKVFYSLQYKKGLMSNRPYDALMNAIDQVPALFKIMLCLILWLFFPPTLEFVV